MKEMYLGQEKGDFGQERSEKKKPDSRSTYK